MHTGGALYSVPVKTSVFISGQQDESIATVTTITARFGEIDVGRKKKKKIAIPAGSARILSIPLGPRWKLSFCRQNSFVCPSSICTDYRCTIGVKERGPFSAGRSRTLERGQSDVGGKKGVVTARPGEPRSVGVALRLFHNSVHNLRAERARGAAVQPRCSNPPAASVGKERGGGEAALVFPRDPRRALTTNPKR